MASQIFLLFVLLAIHQASSQRLLPQQELDYPKPFNFEYHSDLEDGGNHYHTSSGDGSGKVVGSYGLTDVDGRQRIVEYEADELGFRANVRSNEPGVVNSNPADVQVIGAGGPITGDHPIVRPPSVPRPGLGVPVGVGRPVPVRPRLVPDYVYGGHYNNVGSVYGGDSRLAFPGTDRYAVPAYSRFGVAANDRYVTPDRFIGANRFVNTEGYLPVRR